MAPELKTAPRGYPRDHPRIDLLRRKRFVAMTTLEPGPWLHTRKARDRIAEPLAHDAPVPRLAGAHAT